MRYHSAAMIGALGGLLFFAHAMIPNSHAWPLLWPAMAVVAAAARSGAMQAGLMRWVARAAGAGLIAGALFLVATAAALNLLGMPGFGGMARALGANGPVLFNGAVLLSLAVAALIGVIAAALAGAAAYPVARRWA